MPVTLIPAVIAAYAGALLWFFVVAARPVTLLGMGVGALAAAGVVGGVASYVKRWRWPAVLVMCFLGLLLAAGLVLLGARILFIVREGGMDRADGYGSPAAFLLGMVFEQCLLSIPAVIFWLGYRMLPHSTRKVVPANVA